MPRPKPRRRLHWVAYLWPGLPHLWVRGSLAGLTLAVAFSVVLNVLVLATFVWPAWLETRLKFGCAITAGGLWLAALWETRGELRRLAAEKAAAERETDPNAGETPPQQDEPLREALASYLRDDLVDAERRLRRLIRRDQDDFESRLWLVSVLRHSGRPQHAARLLRRLQRRDAAAAWQTEIADEHARLDTLLNRLQEPSEENSDGAPTLLPIRPEVRSAA